MDKGARAADAKGNSHAGRSAVLPYRGGADEAGMLPGFVSTVMQGGIDELVIGVDGDIRAYPEVTKAYKAYGGRVRAVRVPSSPDWGFRFAAVLWHLISSAKHDLVLVTNVDELPSRAALGWPERAGGADGYVLESGSDTTPDSTDIPAWTGTFWLWRPALESYVDLGEYKKIRDGGDSFLFRSAIRAGKRYKARHGMWVTLRRESHMDLHWFRWKMGLYDCAMSYRKTGVPPLASRMAGSVRMLRGIVLGGAGRSGRDRWWYAGFMAGLLRPRSYWTVAAQDMEDLEWVWQGRVPYDDLFRHWWRRGPSAQALRLAAAARAPCAAAETDSAAPGPSSVVRAGDTPKAERLGLMDRARAAARRRRPTLIAGRAAVRAARRVTKAVGIVCNSLSKGIRYRRRFSAGYTRGYYTDRRDIPECRSWHEGIIRPADMGAALCYAFGATSWEQVRQTLHCDDSMNLPSGASAREQAATIAGAKLGRLPRLVFDIGCGRGEVAATLAYLGVRAVAVDPSASAGALVGETAQKFYGLAPESVPFTRSTGIKALRMHNEVPDTIVFCESVEHIPLRELHATFEWIACHAAAIPGGILVVITNWPRLHPIRAVSGDWDHVHDVDDDLYDQLCSYASRTVTRRGSHLVLHFE